jgi:hypothetical protein
MNDESLLSLMEANNETLLKAADEFAAFLLSEPYT